MFKGGNQVLKFIKIFSFSNDFKLVALNPYIPLFFQKGFDGAFQLNSFSSTKMSDNRVKATVAQTDVGRKLSSVKESSKPNSEKFSNLYDKKTLKKALKYLLRQEDKRVKKWKKENCKTEHVTESKVDYQVKLRCRQLPNVLHELRKAIMRQDWDESATLLMILCHPGLKLYNSIIIKSCLLLLFNHPNSNLELLQDFVRYTTGYIVDEDVNKFIRILFVLRKCALNPLGSGKYVRKCADYKVTRDAEFEEI